MLRRKKNRRSPRPKRRTKKNSIKLKLLARTESLKAIRDTLMRMGESLGVQSDILFSLVLAVDEACSNVIRHGYGYENGGDQPLTVDIDISPRRISIVIRDRGRAYDINQFPRVPIQEAVARRAEGGYGVQIIKSLVDKWNCSRTQAGENQLQLVKYLKTPKP